MRVIIGFLKTRRRKITKKIKQLTQEKCYLDKQIKEGKDTEIKEKVQEGEVKKSEEGDKRIREIKTERRKRQISIIRMTTKSTMYFLMIQMLRFLNMVIKGLLFIFGPVVLTVILAVGFLVIMIFGMLGKLEIGDKKDDMNQVTPGGDTGYCSAEWSMEELQTRGVSLTDDEKNLYKLVMLAKEASYGTLTGEPKFADYGDNAVKVFVGVASTENSMVFYDNPSGKDFLKHPSDKGHNAGTYGIFGLAANQTMANEYSPSASEKVKAKYKPETPYSIERNYIPYAVTTMVGHFNSKMGPVRNTKIHETALEIGAKFDIKESLNEFAEVCELLSAQAAFHGVDFPKEKEGYITYWAALWAASNPDDSKRGLHNVTYNDKVGYSESEVRHCYIGHETGKFGSLGNKDPQDLRLKKKGDSTSGNHEARIVINGEVIEVPLWTYLDSKYKGKVPQWDKAWETQRSITQRGGSSSSGWGVAARALNFHYGVNSYIQGNRVMNDIASKLVGTNCSSGGGGAFIAGVGKPGENTLTNMMNTMFMPLGRVMYSWGGGRMEDGKYQQPVGMGKRWLPFYEKKKAENKKYNFRDYRVNGNPTADTQQNGLDCSGYVGWVLHNTRMDGNYYAVHSSGFGGAFTGFGLGKVLPSAFNDYRPGDVFYNNGHVFMIVGPSEKGGAVIIHASPNGLKLGGIDGGVETATHYMDTYYPEVSKNQGKVFNFGSYNQTSYKGKYKQFRFNIVEAGNKKGIEDPDGIYDMTAEQILKIMFKENQSIEPKGDILDEI